MKGTLVPAQNKTNKQTRHGRIICTFEFPSGLQFVLVDALQPAFMSCIHVFLTVFKLEVIELSGVNGVKRRISEEH